MLQLGLSLLKTRVVISGSITLVTDFTSRVLSDSGTVERTLCLVKELEVLNVFSVTATYWTPYKTRIETDGGIAEAQSCVLSELENLNA